MSYPFQHLLDDATQYALQSPPAAERLTQVVFQFTSDVKHLLSTRTIALLPTELLCEIFIFACAVDPHTDPPLEPNSIMRITPMLIAAVNKRWRTIILDLPAAWSCIDINFHVGIEVRRNKYGLILAHLIQLHLDRSLPCPLSIRLRIPPRSPDRVLHVLLMKPLTFYFIQSLLVPHCARWRHVSIDVCGKKVNSLYLPFQLMPSLRLPMLEALTIENAEPDPPQVPFCEALAEATSLKHIQFKGGRVLLPLLEQLQPRLLRSQQIQTVVLDGFRYDTLLWHLAILYKVHRVICRDMELSPGQFGVQLELPPTASSVRNLTVVFGWQINLRWFKFLTASKLQGIEFIHIHPTSLATDGLSSAIIEFCNRSQITLSLRRLVLKGVVMWSSDVVSILRTAPQLEELVLHEPVGQSTTQFPNYLFEMDDIQEEPHMISETFCLRLSCDESLGAKLHTMELVWSCDLSVDAVLDMLDERKKIVNVGLGTRPFNRFGPSDMERVMTLREEGRTCCLVPN
ncbi:hypothetical protein CPB85DRAFT_1437505 [Mucidula mucida]|nr:hypothetical protein CPB85DRAFT_1437505 [Mucidula mucida]